MPFQRLSGRLSGRLNYYITQWGRVGVQTSWSLDELEKSWGRESQHPAEGALGTPDGVWGPDQLVIRCSRESQQSGPRASGWALENEKDTTLMAIRVGVIYCSSVRSLTPSHSKTLSNLTIHSEASKLQHYGNFIIRLFSVIFRTLVGRWGVSPVYRDAVGVFFNPSRLGNMLIRKKKKGKKTVEMNVRIRDASTLMVRLPA